MVNGKVADTDVEMVRYFLGMLHHKALHQRVKEEGTLRPKISDMSAHFQKGTSIYYIPPEATQVVSFPNEGA